MIYVYLLFIGKALLWIGPAGYFTWLFYSEIRGASWKISFLFGIIVCLVMQKDFMKLKIFPGRLISKNIFIDLIREIYTISGE